MPSTCLGQLAQRLARRLPWPPLLPAPRSAPCHRLAVGRTGTTALARSPAPSWNPRHVFGQRRHRHRDSKPPAAGTKLGEAHKLPVHVATGETPKANPAGLHENIYTIPNILTLTRLAAAPAIGCLVIYDARAWAVGLFAYAAITDVVDGWIARRWNCKTVVGTVIDPMADKALMTILTVCLAVTGDLPVWVATIILGRDAGLGIAAIYYRWISLPPPKTVARYWDFSLPSAEVRPTTISKYNTFLQLTLVGATTVAPLIDVDMSPTLGILQYVVAITTLWSGLSYIASKDAVKIIK